MVVSGAQPATDPSPAKGVYDPAHQGRSTGPGAALPSSGGPATALKREYVHPHRCQPASDRPPGAAAGARATPRHRDRSTGTCRGPDARIPLRLRAAETLRSQDGRERGRAADPVRAVGAPGWRRNDQSRMSRERMKTCAGREGPRGRAQAHPGATPDE